MSSQVQIERTIYNTVMKEALNGLGGAADFAVQELQEWTSTWNTKPEFSQSKEDEKTIVVTGDDPVRAGRRSRLDVLINGAEGPWEIKPKQAKALSWKDGETGEQVFAKRVIHPGIQPHPVPQKITDDLCNSPKVTGLF